MEWRRSSKSGGSGDCVEVRQDHGAVRDSKHRQAILPLTREAVARLISHLR